MSDNNPHNKGRRKSALKNPTTEFKRKPSESYVLYRQSTTTNDGNSSKILFCESGNTNNVLGQGGQDNSHTCSHVSENDDIFCLAAHFCFSRLQSETKHHLYRTLS